MLPIDPNTIKFTFKRAASIKQPVPARAWRVTSLHAKTARLHLYFSRAAFILHIVYLFATNWNLSISL